MTQRTAVLKVLTGWRCLRLSVAFPSHTHTRTHEGGTWPETVTDANWTAPNVQVRYITSVSARPRDGAGDTDGIIPSQRRHHVLGHFTMLLPPPISIHPYPPPPLLLLLDPGNRMPQVPRPALSLFPQPVLTSSAMTSRRSSTTRLFHFVFLKLLLIRDVIGRTTTNGKPSQLSLLASNDEAQKRLLGAAVTLQSTSTSPDSTLAHHLPTFCSDSNYYWTTRPKPKITTCSSLTASYMQVQVECLNIKFTSRSRNQTSGMM